VESFHIEYVVVAMLILILYLLYYVFSKDAQYSKHIRSVATVVEELHREIYYLKKQLSKTQGSLSRENAQRMNDEEIYQEIERSVYDLVHPLTSAMEQIQYDIVQIQQEFEERFANIESGVKQISIPSAIHGNDEQKVISLYKQGVEIDTIAKELHIAKPEVEFILKINKIK
jgi:DNA anti-recombination protein RmuC